MQLSASVAAYRDKGKAVQVFRQVVLPDVDEYGIEKVRSGMQQIGDWCSRPERV